MSVRQGSASYTIVIAAVTSVLVGGFLLTFLVYPFHNFMTAAAFWEPETAVAARVFGVVSGLWQFWGVIVLLTVLSFVWITTRQ